MVAAFLHVLTEIILPLFLLIGVGFVLEKICRLDMRTLTKVIFHVFVPAIIFVKILESSIALNEVTAIVLFAVIHTIAMLAVAVGVCQFRPLRSHRKVIAMGAMFFNSGNYGLPFVEMAFPGFGIGIMAVILLMQNLVNFTLGIWIITWGREGGLRRLLGFLRVPAIHAMAAGVLVRVLHVNIPEPVMAPLNLLTAGLIPLALVTLGAQLAKTRMGRAAAPLTALSILRLVASPLVAAAIVHFLRMPTDIGKVCIAAAGLPVAVNVFILAMEYNEDKELASQGVFWTTVLSAVTITALLIML